MDSGTIYGTTSNKSIDCKIEWSSITNPARNSSYVTATLCYRRTNTYSGTPTNGTGTFSISIDGQNGSTTVKLTIPNDKSWVTAITIAKNVSHNNDGTKSITISASGSINGTSLSATYCSGTAVLDNIPRQATITSASAFDDEGNPSFTFTNPANATLSCWLEPNPIGDHLCERTLSGASGTYTWDLTEEERNQLRMACKGSSCYCRIGLYSTINGVQYSSYVDTVLKIINAEPIFTDANVTYADVSRFADVTENNQHIVQNKSLLTVYIEPAIAQKGAEITGYFYSFNGQTQRVMNENEPLALGVVNSSRDIVIKVMACDSRGNMTTVEKTITVLPYEEPIIKAELERLNNYEDTTYLTVDATISSVNGKNSADITYNYKQNGGSYIYEKDKKISNKTKDTVTCDKNYAYTFIVTVTDKFSFTTHEYPLSKGKFPLFIDTDKNAVGINDFPIEGEALRVAGGVARFCDGIVMSGGTKNFIITINDSGVLQITEME